MLNAVNNRFHSYLARRFIFIARWLSERFSLKCRKVIGFALTTLRDSLKNSRHFFIQSEVKPMPIVAGSHTFPALRVGGMLTTSSFDWLNLLFMSIVIGQGLLLDL